MGQKSSKLVVQHHKRVGNYLIGSRKLGEGSFAKVREGLHVLTGEKVSHPGRWPLDLPASQPRDGRSGREYTLTHSYT